MHSIRGEEYDAEMSIYHVRKDGKGIIAVSILFQADDDYDNFRPLKIILDKWHQTKQEQQQQQQQQQNNLSLNHLSVNSTVGNVVEPTSKIVTTLRERLRKRAMGNAVVQDDQIIMTLRERIHKRMGEHDTGIKHYATKGSNITSNLIHYDEVREPFNVYEFMPTDYFYSYLGSLTAPTCSSIVDWHVMDRPLLISSNQLNEIHQLLQFADTAQIRTSRPIRGGSNDRKVAHCTENNFKGKKNK